MQPNIFRWILGNIPRIHIDKSSSALWKVAEEGRVAVWQWKGGQDNLGKKIIKIYKLYECS